MMTHDATNKELPEAFKEPTEPEATTVYDNDPIQAQETTSTGMDRVEEGSAESFPGSDVPSTSPPTKVADRPADPTT